MAGIFTQKMKNSFLPPGLATVELIEVPFWVTPLPVVIVSYVQILFSLIPRAHGSYSKTSRS